MKERKKERKVAKCLDYTGFLYVFDLLKSCLESRDYTSLEL